MAKKLESISLRDFHSYNETLSTCSCPDCGGLIQKTIPQIDDTVECGECNKEFIITE